MLGLVFDTPLLIIGPVLVVIMGFLATVGLLVMRRRVLPRLRVTAEDGEFINTMVQSVMMFYALTVALIAVAAWESYSDASNSVSHEATELAVLYRDVSSYPLPVRTQLQGALREYVKYVIRDAWPEQQAGRVPRGGVERIRRFEEILTGFEPSTEGQKILHAETLRAHDQMIEARRTRLEAVQIALPGVMWTVILIGAALGLTGSYFFRVGDVHLHISLVVLLATFIALVIFVVLAFDRPFRGDLGISSEPYQLVYEQLMER